MISFTRSLCTALLFTAACTPSYCEREVLVSDAVANLMVRQGKTGGIEITVGCENEPTVDQAVVIAGGLQQQLEALARVTPNLTWRISGDSIRVTIGKSHRSSLIRVSLPALSVDGRSARAAGDDVLGQPAVQKVLEISRLKLFAVSPGFSAVSVERHMISLPPSTVGEDLDSIALILKGNVWIYRLSECGQRVGKLTWMH
jgi:hypothetical protein